MKKFLSIFGIVLFNLAIIASLGVSYLIYINTRELPDYKQLENYDPPVVTRFYSGDGKLLEEYAIEKRSFVAIEAIPQGLINAFIAAEDKNFYDHLGVDFTSILRASMQNLINASQNKNNLVGGSTITQQVVKNFLLTNEKSLSRKIKEAVLSYRITKAFSKEKILELYLNQIYLGANSYGVASAAQNYFNKSINELSVAEFAFLAALPKAPSSYNPAKQYDKALARRNWVLDRMYIDGFLNKEDALNAMKEPIKITKRSSSEVVQADFFAEAVRQQILDKYGEKALYSEGLLVRTTLDPNLQIYATKTLKEGLEKFDRKRGLRKISRTIKNIKEWQDEIKEINKEFPLTNLAHACVLGIEKGKLKIGTNDGIAFILQENLSWGNDKGKSISNFFKPGDVITFSITKKGEEDVYKLEQIPKVNGAIVAMDPHTGRVLAMVGGYDFKTSKFNRANQALRQPGSSFKPFVYLSALENNYSPSTLIEDAPIELSTGVGQKLWRPKNYSGDFLGPTTLRRGLELSRNTMTVNLAMVLGLDKIKEITNRFGISDVKEGYISMVLGSMETTVLKMVNAYSMVVNGGKKIEPTLIEKIQDRHGRTIYKRDDRVCEACNIVDENYKAPTEEDELPILQEFSETVTDPRSAFQLVSILRGAMEHTNSAKIIRDLGKTIGGKTGTTNNSNDAWFIGFTPDLVVGVYVGYDLPHSLGKRETGATVALPIFADFMKHALVNKPDVPFRTPKGIKLMRVDYLTGQQLQESSKFIYEAFKQESLEKNGGLKEEEVIEFNPSELKEEIKEEQIIEQMTTPSEESGGEQIEGTGLY